MSQDSKDLVIALNLYILQTISQVAKEDISDAMIRFGISREIASRLSLLNTAQLFEISKSPAFLFKIDMDSIAVIIKDNQSGSGYGSMHNAISNIARLLNNDEGGK